ncbi:MAG: hypothetical protein V1906_00800 [Candidatus Woesearchaeota archaeon]
MFKYKFGMIIGMTLKGRLKGALFRAENLDDLRMLREKNMEKARKLRPLNQKPRDEISQCLEYFYPNAKARLENLLGCEIKSDPKIVYVPAGNFSCMRQLFELAYPMNVIMPTVAGIGTGALSNVAGGLQAAVVAFGATMMYSYLLSTGKVADKSCYSFDRVVLMSQNEEEAKIELAHDLAHHLRKQENKFRYFNRFLEDGLANGVAHNVSIHLGGEIGNIAYRMNAAALGLAIDTIEKKAGNKQMKYDMTQNEILAAGDVADYGGLSMMLLAEHRHGEDVYGKVFSGDYKPLLE